MKIILTNKNSLRKGLSLLEMVIALAMIIIIAAAILPQLKVINDSWASKQANSEVLQNARVLLDQVNRSLSCANRVTAVSDPCEINGYIEFEDNTGTPYRFDIAANNYIEFGPTGSLSDLAGPVSQLKITCYDDDDLDTPVDIAVAGVDGIRFVEFEIIFTNPGTGQDRTFTSKVYLRTNGNNGNIGWWKLDDPCGFTATDSSGNNNHGTLHSMTGDEWTDGIVDGALTFDGSDDYIDGIGDCPTSSFSILAWARDTGAEGGGNWSVIYSAEQEIWLGVDRAASPVLWLDCGGNGKGASTAAGAWTRDAWHHIAATWDESDIHLYIDGVDMPITVIGTPENPQAKAAVIGAYSKKTNDETWYGELDDIRLYNRVLTAEEIAGFIGDYSVTPGTPFRFESVHTVQTPVLSKIDDTHYLCSYDTGSDGWATVLVVDTDTMTVTEETDYMITATGGMNPTLNQIDSTHYLYAHSDQAPDDDGWARVLQVNTSSWVITAAANYEYDTSRGGDAFIEQIDSTHYLCTYDGPGDEAFAVVLTVNTSDWTVTAGTPFSLGASTWETDLARIDDTHFLCGYKSAPGLSKGYLIVLEVDTSDWTISTPGLEYRYHTKTIGLLLEELDSSHVLGVFEAIGECGWSLVYSINTSTWDIMQILPKYQIRNQRKGFALERTIGGNYLHVAASTMTGIGEGTVIQVDAASYETSEKDSPVEFGSDVDTADIEQIEGNYYLCVYTDSSSDGWAVILNVDAVADSSSGDAIEP